MPENGERAVSPISSVTEYINILRQTDDRRPGRFVIVVPDPISAEFRG